jgi:hypothetical protein
VVKNRSPRGFGCKIRRMTLRNGETVAIPVRIVAKQEVIPFLPGCPFGSKRKKSPPDELADSEFLIFISSGELNVLTAVVLNFENLVAKVLPITISSAAMVKKKGRLIGIGIFEPDEHFSTLDNSAALCALLYFRHCFLTYRGLEQALRR